MIVLDVQALQSPAYARRGVGRYVFELVRALLADHRSTVDALAWNDRFERGQSIAELEQLDGAPARLRPFSSLRGCDVDVLHVLAPFAAIGRAPGEANDYLDMAVPVRARRLLVTVYDMIPWRFGDRYLAVPDDKARYHNRMAMLTAADEVLAISQSAAADAVELADVDPGRVRVVGAGAGPQFRPPTDALDDRLRRIGEVIAGVRKGFVLVAAADDWRKNLEGALDAYAQLPAGLRERHQLVVAGAGLDRLDLPPDVLGAGFVDDDLLVALYQSAELVVVPSRYEGFGLPVVEARACGARVICSDVASLREVLPDARARFDPDDTASIAGVLHDALSDPGTQAMLDAIRSDEHTWAVTAAHVAAAYEHHRTPARRTSHTRRARIAVASVIPPTPSGVASHSERLVAGLAGLDDVELSVFTTSSWRRLARSPGIVIQHLAALPQRWMAGSVDHVVYCIGNGSVHRPFYDMLRLVPGHVLLHDVRTPLLFGPAGPAGRPIAHEAVAVLVQSRHAVDLLHELDRVTALDIGPHPCWNDGSAQPIDDGEPPWIVSAGIAHEAKQTDRFVDAARILQRRRPVRAAIVGDGGQRFVREGDAIVVTGHVDDATFDTWLRRATVMVQLRAESNGESSGVAAHGIGRGVPLVVTDIGAMRELPEAVAQHVDVDVSAEQLADVIERLLDDPEGLARRRRAALAFAAGETAGAQARRLVDAVLRTACEDGAVENAKQAV